MCKDVVGIILDVCHENLETKNKVIKKLDDAINGNVHKVIR